MFLLCGNGYSSRCPLYLCNNTRVTICLYISDRICSCGDGEDRNEFIFTDILWFLKNIVLSRCLCILEFSGNYVTQLINSVVYVTVLWCPTNVSCCIVCINYSTESNKTIINFIVSNYFCCSNKPLTFGGIKLNWVTSISRNLISYSTLNCKDSTFIIFNIYRNCVACNGIVKCAC